MELVGVPRTSTNLGTKQHPFVSLILVCILSRSGWLAPGCAWTAGAAGAWAGGWTERRNF